MAIPEPEFSVGIVDNELRIDLMNQFNYFLPHLLALSCSSPFWEGENTGLLSYRPTVFDALQCSGNLRITNRLSVQAWTERKRCARLSTRWLRKRDLALPERQHRWCGQGFAGPHQSADDYYQRA